MAIEVIMPQMGESVVEGTVEKWLVKEGDIVAEDQPLCAISTDKVDTEIPSPGAGRIAKIIAAEGETLPIGAKLAIIEPTGAAAGAPPPPKPPAKVAKVAPAPPAKAGTAQRRPVEPAAKPAREIRLMPSPAPPAPAMAQAPLARHGGADGAHRRFSPVVLKIAADQGIDLSRVSGTGIGGRVSKRDVMAYIEALEKGAPAAVSVGPTRAAAAPLAATQPALAAAPAAAGAVFRAPLYQPREGDVVEPFSRRRKIIAEHMVYSKTHAPHVGTVAEVDITRAMALRQRHKAAFQEREGFALTLLPLAAAATVRALKEFPRMNASVAGDSVIIRREINLGIAMDTDDGLVVPVIRAAEAMSAVGLAREIERLRRKVADKTLTADDLAGGSFTLSNPGREGNLYGFAIINQPQVGILRMGEIKKRPVVVEVDGAEAIAIRTMMYLALSYDHRVIDGVLGNGFLYRTARLLEEADFEL
jgi:pyruvate/2-oxoglutarate dehydrogenase complex dihydrolipoamide acyltransferase (E2) component